MSGLHLASDYSFQYDQKTYHFNLMGPTNHTCAGEHEGRPLRQQASLVEVGPDGACRVVQPYRSTAQCQFKFVTVPVQGQAQEFLEFGLAEFRAWLICDPQRSLSALFVDGALRFRVGTPTLCGITLPRFLHRGFPLVLTACLFFAAGLVLLILGNQMLRVSIFASSVVLTYLALATALDLRHCNSATVYILAVLAISVQVGLVMLLYPRLGVTSLMLLFGVVFSLLLQAAVLNLTGTLLGLWITMGVVGGLLAIVSLARTPAWLLYISTSFSGAYLLVRPLGFWFGDYPPEFTVATTHFTFYFFFAAMIVLGGIGVAIQRAVHLHFKDRFGNAALQQQLDDPVNLRALGDNVKDRIKAQYEGVIDAFQKVRGQPSSDERLG